MDEPESSKEAERRMRGARKELKSLATDADKFVQMEERRRRKRIEEGHSSGHHRHGRKLPPVYDSQGIHINSKKDLCDCLHLECPGCHLPCKRCGSTKCGLRCRCDRKWMYTQVVEQHPFEESTVLRTRPF